MSTYTCFVYIALFVMWLVEIDKVCSSYFINMSAEVEVNKINPEKVNICSAIIIKLIWMMLSLYFKDLKCLCYNFTSFECRVCSIWLRFNTNTRECCIYIYWINAESIGIILIIEILMKRILFCKTFSISF